MDIESQLLRKMIEAMDEYERAKRAESMRRCRQMKKILKQFETKRIIKGINED